MRFRDIRNRLRHPFTRTEREDERPPRRTLQDRINSFPLMRARRQTTTASLQLSPRTALPVLPAPVVPAPLTFDVAATFQAAQRAAEQQVTRPPAPVPPPIPPLPVPAADFTPRHLGTLEVTLPPTIRPDPAQLLRQLPPPPRDPIPIDRTSSYRVAAMPTDADTLRAVLVSAKLASYVYTRDPATLPGDWAPSTDLATALQRDLGLPADDGVQRPHGTLVDAASGLVATVLVSPGSREVVLAFGGTTSGHVAGGAMDRVFGNVAMSATQWTANLTAGLGRLPRSYDQAAQLLQALSARMDAPPWRGHALRTVGHSKGGGEAIYAALSQPLPMRGPAQGVRDAAVRVLSRQSRG